MKQENIIRIQKYASPCGDLLLGAFEDKLCLCDWVQSRHHEAVKRRVQRMLNATFEESVSNIGMNTLNVGESISDIEESTSYVLSAASTQLDEYFSGTRTHFTLPLLFCGSDFQMRVWRELLKIPYGTTLSYAGLAQKLECPSAVRALANACGANVISIFAPCHRIIGSNGALGGYAGGNDAKRHLLELEHYFCPAKAC